MLAGKPWSEWVAWYSRSHQHPANRVCHVIGIPLIAVSLPLFVVLIVFPRFWPLPVALFVLGWIFQFVGHAFERKPPEFFHDWRFLFVGLRWWFAEVRGHAEPRRHVS
ncbi:MAG TPA: DUF962 domain-containing protein [Gammaproteobacteria bacterium]|nr:DUF962 domain-containing protein [Gammaproteobacteria bacterium]